MITNKAFTHGVENRADTVMQKGLPWMCQIRVLLTLEVQNGIISFLLRKILIEGGITNFCFSAIGLIFILNEFKIWRAQPGTHIKGALPNDQKKTSLTDK